MFSTTRVIIPALVINGFARSTIIAGSQAVVATLYVSNIFCRLMVLFSFPSEYIGTLTGVMWTVAGVITFIQYALVKLTTDVSKSWRVSHLFLL